MLTPKKRTLVKKKKRRKFSFARFLFFVVAIAFFIILIQTVFFSNFLEITSVNIQGNKYIVQETILEKINLRISGKYLNFINKNNLFLIQINKIKNDLLKEFKIIRNITIKRKFPNSLEVNVFERQPQMIFCTAGDCFMIDEKREAYDNFNIQKNENKNDFLILTDKNSKKINLGDFILDESYMKYLLGIRNKLEEINIETENNFKTASFISKDIRVKTKEGWEIYFNEGISLDKEIKVLKIVLDNKIENNQQKDLEYIDLRIENKVYYKFRDGTPSQIAKENIEKTLQDTDSVKDNEDDSDGDKDKKKK